MSREIEPVRRSLRRRRSRTFTEVARLVPSGRNHSGDSLPAARGALARELARLRSAGASRAPPRAAAPGRPARAGLRSKHVFRYFVQRACLPFCRMSSVPVRWALYQ